VQTVGKDTEWGVG